MHAYRTLALLLAVGSFAAAGADSPDLPDAVRTADEAVLAGFARAADAGVAHLARGVLAELAGADAAAVRELRVALAASSLAPPLRVAALMELGGLYMRNQQYARAVAQFEAADAIHADGDANELRSLRRALANARALAPLAPMSSSVASADVVPLERDPLDFART